MSAIEEEQIAQERFRAMLAEGQEMAVAWDRDVDQADVCPDIVPRLYWHDRVVYPGARVLASGTSGVTDGGSGKCTPVSSVSDDEERVFQEMLLAGDEMSVAWDRDHRSEDVEPDRSPRMYRGQNTVSPQKTVVYVGRWRSNAVRWAHPLVIYRWIADELRWRREYWACDEEPQQMIVDDPHE